MSDGFAGRVFAQQKIVSTPRKALFLSGWLSLGFTNVLNPGYKRSVSRWLVWMINPARLRYGILYRLCCGIQPFRHLIEWQNWDLINVTGAIIVGHYRTGPKIIARFPPAVGWDDRTNFGRNAFAMYSCYESSILQRFKQDSATQ
jgi:hypothetical protein